MISNDNLHVGGEARERLCRGIRKAAAAVGATMGTQGSNVLIQAIENPGHYVTNDGATILANIRFSDPLEEVGRNVLYEAVSRANKQSGDGSSTTTVLTAAIIEEGLNSPEPAISIKRSLEAALPIVEEAIKAQSREITVDTVGQVATISAEDEGIGNKIQEIYQQIGKDGIIYWDVSKTNEDTYTIGTGITVNDAGYLSPYMCDATESGQNANQIRLKNPKILVTKQKIASGADINHIAQAVHAQNLSDLVVFADEIDPLVVGGLVQTRIQRGFRIVVVKMPVVWKDQWFEDIALATGATLIDPSGGLALKDATADHLGTVDNLIITRTETYLDGIKDLSTHIESLKAEDTDDSNHRAARLNTKTARYFVGAPSESALAYRRLKVEDAIAAAYQALHHGIVPGGGTALVNASAVVKGTNTLGGKILSVALEAPSRQIYANAGAYVPDMYLYSGTDVGGFDSRTGKEIGNMFEAGIVDPTIIVINAVRNAVSVASSVLSAPAVVTLPIQDETLS